MAGAVTPADLALVSDNSGTVPNTTPAGVIYFFQAPEREDLIYVGFSSDFPTRRRKHENDGRTLLALMPGSVEFEARLHKHFRSAGVEVRPSQYQGQAIVDYVEGLVSKGVAVIDPLDVAHTPTVPWSVVDPAVKGGHRDTVGQLGLFRLPVRERVKRAASAAYHASESDEWYTPTHVVEAARIVLGTIDLDPASCPRANATVRARHYFSQQVSGLAHDWSGRVWMNPPYGDLAQEFTAHLFRQLDARRVPEAIVLLNQNSMSSAWFDPIYDRASCMVVTSGRLRFEAGDPGQAFSSPATGSVICYFGPNVEKFRSAFSEIGRALLPVPADGRKSTRAAAGGDHGT